MAITLFRSQGPSIIPASGSLTGTAPNRSVAHPALPTVPRFADELVASQPGLEAPYFAPPDSVLRAAWAREFEVSCELSAVGLTLEIEEAPIALSLASTWAEQIRLAASATGTWTAPDPVVDGDSYLQLTVTVSATNIWFDYTSKLWWPGLYVLLTAVNADPEELGTNQIFIGLGDTAGSATAVEVDFCGATFALLQGTQIGSAPPIIGSITVRTSEYLAAD